MKKRIGIRALAVLLSASMIWSAASGAVYALPASADASGVSNAADASDTSSGSEIAAGQIPTGVEYDSGSVEGSTVPPTGLSGAGTEANPYQISSVANLKSMGDYINYENSGDKHFVLTQDINLSSLSFNDLTDYDDVYAIASAEATLSGNSNVHFHLNGNNHKLTGLNISISNSVAAFGIFGYVNANSTIENVIFESNTVSGLRAYDTAYGLIAAQNNGTIRNCSVVNCTFDMFGGSVSSVASDTEYLASLDAGRIYKGLSLVTADNNGTISGVSVSATSSDKGIIVKGGRSFIGSVAGQNRKTITDVEVSGVRLICYGSSDSRGTVSGEGVCAQYVGGIAGRNNYRANRTGTDGAISDSSVNLSNGSDILFGDYVGGVAGANGGSISSVEVDGIYTPEGGAPAGSAANMYGYGRYGAIAGSNSGSIVSCGAYDVGFCFSKQDENNCYGGIAGWNSGSISSSVSSGSVNVNSRSEAGVGGVVGNAQSGTTLIDNYSFVYISQQTANTGGLVGKNGTTVHIGQNNYWSSKVSGVAYPVPESGAGQNDLQVNISVINVPAGAGGVAINSSSMSHVWSGSSATVTFDSSGTLSSDNAAIIASTTSTGFNVRCSTSGEFGNFRYYASINLPSGVGISGKSLSVRLSIPVLVTDTAAAGAGTSAANPIILTSYQQFKFIAYAPSASYRMGADFAIGSDWSPIAFTGTFDGDGHTLNTYGQIFTEVSGSRTVGQGDDVTTSAWANNSAYLASGYIYDVTLCAPAIVSGPAFGTLNNATLINVDYDAINGGGVDVAVARGAAVVGSAIGNVYMQDCQTSLPVSISSTSADGIGALVGYVAANVFVMDNCGSSSEISMSTNLSSVGGLVGSVSSLSSVGLIRNSFASGSVYTTSGSSASAKIMVGTVTSSASSRLSYNNCYYSLYNTTVSGAAVATRPAPQTASGITELSFAQTAYDVATEAASETTITLAMPSNITELASLSASDFTVAFENSSYVEVTTNPTVSSGTVSLGVSTPSSQTDDFTTTMTITHVPSGLKSRVTLRSGLRVNDGFYEIYTIEDLREIANGFNGANSSTYCAANYKLCADLDLSNETTSTLPRMAATYGQRFTGSFVGKEKTDGSKYTLSNLTITGNGSASTHAPAALFGFASGATFRNFKLDGFTVTNTGVGAAVLVGAADGYFSTMSSGVITATNTSCTFEDIEITNCTVTSTRDALSTDAVPTISVANLRNVTQAGALIGGIFSAGTTDIYSIRNILVKDTTVQCLKNKSMAVGGLIGDIRWGGTIGTANPPSPAGGIVQIGAAGAEPSIVMDNVTVKGYSLVGGIVGKAGAFPVAPTSAPSSTTLRQCRGGINITNVQVKNSLIETPHTSVAWGGICGGILGSEKVSMGANYTNATITDCSVENTSIISNNVITSPTTVGSDTGGIAGQMSGVIRGCTVTDCTIKSCCAGGIVGKPSKKGPVSGTTTAAQSYLLIDDCAVLGNTTITNNAEASALEVGGILSSTRNACAVDVTDCGIGADVKIGDVNITDNLSVSYAGGIIGALQGSNSVNVRNCTMSGSVEILEVSSESAVGGIIGNSVKNVTLTSVDSCVVTGDLNDNSYYCGGIFGRLSDVTNVNTNYNTIVNCTVTSRINQTTSSGFSTTPTLTCKLIGRLGVNDGGGGWLDSPDLVMSGNIVSSYPQDCKLYGPIEGDTADNYDDYASVASYLAQTYVDVNKPAGKYLHDSTTSFPINGSVSNYSTLSITNEATSVLSGSPARLVFDDTTDTSLKRYLGWMSTGNGLMEVTAAEAISNGYSVSLHAKKNASAIGVTGSYIIQSYTEPDSGDTLYIDVMIPVVCYNIDLDPLDGQGTAASPFLIRTKEDLDSVRYRDMSKYYALAADIEFEASDFANGGDFYNSGNFFVPIGYDVSNGTVTPFTGNFTNYYNGMLYYLGGIQINSAADYAGLFAQANTGATFHDVYLDNVTVTGSNSAAALVGTATGTTFTDIEILNTHVSGSDYAGAIAAYATDISATGVTMSNIQIDTAKYVGGLFGHAHCSTNIANNVISVDEITNLTVTAAAPGQNVSSAAMPTAGGIAGQFSGVIQSATITGTGSISGANAGGAVGRVDETGYGLCEIQDVEISGTYAISSSANSVNVAAGGIVGKMRPETGSNGANAVSLDLSVSDCSVGKNVSVSALIYAGGILGSSDSNKGSIAIEDTETFASVRAVTTNNANGSAGGIAGHVYDMPTFTVDGCIAGGSLEAAENIGGVVGYANGTAVSANTFIIRDTVVSCSMSFGSSTASTKLSGVAIGNDVSTIPTGKSALFSHIYYSSFQLGDEISLLGVADSEDATEHGVVINNAYAATALIDVHTAMTYLNANNQEVKQLPVTQEGLTLSTSSIVINLSYTSGGSYLSFVAADDIPFVLTDIVPESNEAGVHLFNYNSTTHTLTLDDQGIGYAVFIYENGIRVGFDVHASDQKGSGSLIDPFVIECVDDFKNIISAPGMHYALGQDIYFNDTTKDPDGPTWQDDKWDDEFSAIVLSGSLSGTYYPFTTSGGEIEYDTTATRNVRHKIVGLSIDSDKKYVGLFAQIGATGSVVNIDFEDCTIVGSNDTDLDGGVGVVAGLSRGTLNDVHVSGTVTTSNGTTTYGSTVTGERHVGGIVGVFLASGSDKIIGCQVTGTAVTADHCAGGIVGGGGGSIGGSSAAACQVTSSTIKANEMAGGILGGNMSVKDKRDSQSNDLIESAEITAPADRSIIMNTSITNCSLSGTTVESRTTNAENMSIGGVIGQAEPGLGTSSLAQYRSLTIQNCTVGTSSSAVTISATVSGTLSDYRNNYTGGVVGYLAEDYKNCVISGCNTHADVSAYGSLPSGSQYSIVGSAAGGLIGATAEGSVYDPAGFSIVNNETSGKLSTSAYAGGLVGIFRVDGSNEDYYYTATGGNFVTGNIVTSKFVALKSVKSGETKPTNTSIGAFFGYSLDSATFIDGSAAAAMRNNYYSSDVSKLGSSLLMFGTASQLGSGGCPTTANPVGFYDVAKDKDNNKSFQVRNHRVENVGGTDVLNLASYFEPVVIGYHFSDYRTDSQKTYEKPIRFVFADVPGASGSNHADIAQYASTSATDLPTLQVYGSKTLTLQDVYVDSSSASAYTSVLTTFEDVGVKRASSNFTITTGGRQGKLIADLGHGLLVEIDISPDPEGLLANGSRTAPYLIPDAETFAYYFFSEDFTDDINNDYLAKYYRQTADISFRDILVEIANNGKTFAPIGDEDSPFVGGYNGDGHTISQFSYSGSEQDVGLFGYVFDRDLNGVTLDYRLRNLHIEILDEAGAAALGGGAVAGVTGTANASGKHNVGGLVGTYMSVWSILNCSVVYGFVECNELCGANDKSNVGGLVGNMCVPGKLDACFTSTDVRAHKAFDAVTSGAVSANPANYAAGGIVGACMSGDATNPAVVFERCFCSSDVVGPEFAGAMIGKVEADAFVALKDCACTATVTTLLSLPTRYDNLSSTNPSIMVGMKISGTGWIDRQAAYVSATNVYVAGLDATAFRYHVVNSGTDIYKHPVLFGNGPLISSDVSGSDDLVESTGVYYDANALGRISLPNGGDYWDVMLMSGEARNNSLSSTVTPAYSINNRSTSELTSMTSFGDGAWNTTDSNLYPVLTLSNTTSSSEPGEGTPSQEAQHYIIDKYFNAFATLSAMPIYTDSRETDDLHIDWADANKSGQRQYSGVTYPTAVAKSVAGQRVSIQSSTYSAANDTSYPTGYDTGLVGNGTNMMTDLLFDMSRDNEILILRNSYLYYPTGASGQSEINLVPRDQRTPKVTVSATIDDISLHRDIRIPLRGEPNTVYAATERQLRAISVPEASGKFYNAYVSAKTNNIRICADIKLNNTIPFTPITGFQGGGSAGTDGARGFDGSNCVISDLYINSPSSSSPVGLFSSLESGGNNRARIQNVILKDVNVTGKDYVGALVGKVTSGESTINNCMVINNDSAVTFSVCGDNYVGGLVGSIENGMIGWTKGDSSTTETANQASGAKVNVYGKNYVGGLAGAIKDSNIANAFATGDVKMRVDANTPSVGEIAIGGFAGRASGSDTNIKYAFASGSVTSNAYSINPSGQIAAKFGIGGFVGVAYINIQECFSSGDVISSTNGYGEGTVYHGVGGLLGYSENPVSDCYSSSTVRYSYGSNVTMHGNVYLGIGGVVGYSTSSVDHCYSSGSIISSELMNANPGSDDPKIYIGGAVGRSTSATGAIFDVWTNNIANLKAVGNLADSASRRSYTTEEFCDGTVFTDGVLESGATGAWDRDTFSSTRGETPNTYPYLKQFCYSDVSDYVRYPAALSIVAVRPNNRDDSARQGKGYSMALTMPTSVSMKYFDKEHRVNDNPSVLWRTYYLQWEAGSSSGSADAGLIQYGHNTFAPIRTSNIEQNLQLRVYVKSYDAQYIDSSGNHDTHTFEKTEDNPADKGYFKGYYEKVTSGTSGAYEIVRDTATVDSTKIHYSDVAGMTKNTYTPRVGDWVKQSDGFRDYGERKITKLYQMMLGTEAYPYLISTVYDLQHIGFKMENGSLEFAQVDEDVDSAQNKDFYGQWYSPITTQGENISGTVYFRFISNVDMTKGVVIDNTGAHTTTGTVTFDPIPSMTGNVYPNSPVPALVDPSQPITFKGIVIDGDDYAVVKFSSTEPFIDTLDAESTVKNLIFDGAAITATDTDDAALIGTNYGTVDGLMLMAPIYGRSTSVISSASGNAAGIAVTNNGVICNSVSGASVTTTGGQYVGGIAAVNNGLIELCVSTASVTAGTGTLGIGGVAGKNTTIDSSIHVRCTANASGAIQVTSGGGNGTIALQAVVPCGFQPAVGNYIKESHRQIIDTISSGSVTGSSTAYAGGFVGVNEGVVCNAVSRAIVSGAFGKAAGFVGSNAKVSDINTSGSITTAYAAGKLTLTGTTSSSKGNLFYAANTNGTLSETAADKALFGSDTYMLYEGADFTEDIISGEMFSQTTKSNKIVLGTGYPEIKAFSTIPAADMSTTNDLGTYTWLKYRMLQGYSKVTACTVDSAYAQYIDTLAATSNNLLKTPALPTIPGSDPVASYTWTADTDNWSLVVSGSGIDTANASGAVTASCAKVAQKIGAGSNTTDDLSYTVSYAFDYAVSPQNPNFNDGDGSSSDPYSITTKDSFSSLVYYGKVSDASFAFGSDVSFEGGHLAYPIEVFKGNLDGKGHTLYDLTIGNETGITDASVGVFSNVTGSISNLGLTGLVLNGTADATHTNFGLLAGETDGATLSNIYAVGELNVADTAVTSAVNVGGLVGYAKNTTTNRIVTSGYIRNDNDSTGSAVGSVFGKMEVVAVEGASPSCTLSNAVSTAYVYGVVTIGGIVGNGASGSISTVRFAGQAADANKLTYVPENTTPPTDTAVISHILATGSATVSNAEFDKQLALFDVDGETSYNSVETNVMAGETINVAGASGETFTTDANNSYYPHAIQIPASASTAFMAGLQFALARVSVTIAGDVGYVSQYDTISVTTPVYPASGHSDDVTLTENRTHYSSGTGPYMTVDSSSALSPNGGSAKGFTGVRADLSRAANTTSFANAHNAIYRYLDVAIVRIIEVEYVVAAASGTPYASDANKYLGVMIRPDLTNKKVSANAMTNINSDASTANGGTYTVKIHKLVVSGDGLTVDSMLPQGYKAAVTSATLFAPDSEDSNTLVSSAGTVTGGNRIVMSGDTTKVQFVLTISSSGAVWGLRSVTGGVQ